MPGHDTIQFSRVFNIIQGTSFCITAITSLSATAVISGLIYSSTSLNRRARQRYTHIIEIMIQSSALYSLALLVQAVTALINDGSVDAIGSKQYNANFYSSTVALITTVCSLNKYSLEFLIIWSHRISLSHQHLWSLVFLWIKTGQPKTSQRTLSLRCRMTYQALFWRLQGDMQVGTL